MFYLKIFKKLKKFFCKWRIVDSTKYTITPFPNPNYHFELTPKQTKQVDSIKGDKEFIFKFNNIGYITKISCNGHLYDITDVDVW